MEDRPMEQPTDILTKLADWTTDRPTNDKARCRRSVSESQKECNDIAKIHEFHHLKLESILHLFCLINNYKHIGI